MKTFRQVVAYAVREKLIDFYNGVKMPALPVAQIHMAAFIMNIPSSYFFEEANAMYDGVLEDFSNADDAIKFLTEIVEGR